VSDVLTRYNKYRNDPVAFLTDCVYTLDQVDQKNPIKLFPIEYDYLKLYCKVWQKYPLLAIPKSRRMTMSWVNIALYLWDTMFHTGRFNAFVSKKEDDSKELIEKAIFIFDHIPEDKIPRSLLPKKKIKQQPPVLEFPELNSKIQGFPMGADQLRQFTFSGILGDECAFWPEAQQFYSASFPTLEGGGRMSLISSPAPGFFKKVVFDTIKSDLDLSTKPASAKSAMQGITTWINKDNRFMVFEIHYTANPHKRSEEYRTSIANSMPRREYLREYELNWDSFEGLPVYGDFNRKIHFTIDTLEPKLGLPLLCGWDFGLTPACIVGQMQGNQLVVLKEFVSINESIDTFAPKVMQELMLAYPSWNDHDKHYRHFIDPSGAFRKDTDSNTCMLEMRKQGLRNIVPGDVTWEKRKTSVNHFLTTHTKDGPGVIMNEAECPTLSKGFLGGFMYPDSYGEIEPTKLRPLKNLYSHPHDAFQYLCGGILRQTKTVQANIPTPQYSFAKGAGNTKSKSRGGALKYGYTNET